MVDQISTDLSLLQRNTRVDETALKGPTQVTDQVKTTTTTTTPLATIEIDQRDLSPQENQRIQLARVQYHLAYVVLSAMNTTQEIKNPGENADHRDVSDEIGQVIAIAPLPPPLLRESPTNPSFSKTQPRRDEAQGKPGVVQPISSLGSPGRETGGNETDDGSPDQSVVVPDPGLGESPEARLDNPQWLMSLLQQFSPEMTADLILEVTAGLYDSSEIRLQEGDTQESRRKYFTRLAVVIEEGFGKVHQEIGQLPAGTETQLHQTRGLIFSGLHLFVDQGIEAIRTHLAASPRQRITAFCTESQQVFERCKATFGQGCYNCHGMFHLIAPVRFLRKG